VWGSGRYLTEVRFFLARSRKREESWPCVDIGGQAPCPHGGVTNTQRVKNATGFRTHGVYYDEAYLVHCAREGSFKCYPQGSMPRSLVAVLWRLRQVKIPSPQIVVDVIVKSFESLACFLESADLLIVP